MFIVTAADGTSGGLHRAEGLVDQEPLLVLLNSASRGLFQLILIFPFLVTSHFSLVGVGIERAGRFQNVLVPIIVNTNIRKF